MTEEEFAECMADPHWRIRNLYYIVNKAGEVVLFEPNESQQRLLDDLWHRNIVPKARQRGISTVVQLAMLDACLFTPTLSAAVIAQDRDTAGKVFSKIKFAYDRLPEQIKAERALVKDSAGEIEFSNGSSLVVATSVRGRTLQWLHVSEFGKICARNPLRAQEIITGSLPAVSANGIVVIESTAEGRSGSFFEMVQEAVRLSDEDRKLSSIEYRLHFFSWWDADEYEADPEGVAISSEDTQYFDSLEATLGIEIGPRKRAWYVLKRRADFSGDQQLMNQEFPSTVEECFAVSTEGAYYLAQMAQARKEKRIARVPMVPGTPCNTFWDIGSSDGCAIWVHQKVGHENRFIRFYQAWGEPYSHAVQWLQELGVVFGTHHLPHDADHVRQGQYQNKSPRDMLAELMPGQRFEVVPRVQDVTWGIQQTRDAFPTCWFDTEHCQAGIDHLDAYRKKWNARQGCWSSEPSKEGGHSEAADALRQFAQGYRWQGAATPSQHAQGRTGRRNNQHRHGNRAAWMV